MRVTRHQITCAGTYFDIPCDVVRQKLLSVIAEGAKKRMTSAIVDGR